MDHGNRTRVVASKVLGINQRQSTLHAESPDRFYKKAMIKH